MSDEGANLKLFAPLLEQLALKAVLLAENDLSALEAFLDDLNQLKEKLAEALPPEVAGLLWQLQETANRLLLNELPTPVRALELFGLGVSLLQQWVQKGDWSESEEWQTFGSLLKELGLSLDQTLEVAGETEENPFANDPELLAGFLAEASEHLEGIETRLVHLEQNPHDQESVNAIFRPFHTIKGVAGFLNLGQIQEVSHEVEFLLDDVRSGRLPVTSDLIDAVLAGVDLLRAMLADLGEAVNGSRSPAGFDLAPFQKRVQALRADSFPPVSTGKVPERPQTLMLDEWRPSPEEATGHQPQPGGEEVTEENYRVPTSQDRFPPLSQGRTVGETAAPATVKVELAKVDLLADLMGELVIAQSQVRQNPALAAVTDQKLARDLGQMARITSELQRLTMSLRMVPIGTTFRKMVRLVRDLSHKVGKAVNLTLEGEDTEIDRNMVEALYEPLVHLVRNAVDHGLESPEERRSRGKPAKGRLWLRAFHKGGNIIIEIEDDGRGLNREAILARAREKGLVAPGDTLTPVQIDHLIFEPGFSTSREVTEISGRGVGMDVVKQTVESLRGQIDIASRPGEGCRFTLRLPLTLAIIDGLLVRVGQERYVIPAVAVRETVHPQPPDYFTVAGQGELIRVRSQLIPMVRLRRLFGSENGDIPVTEGLALIVEHDGEPRALLVDKVLGKQEVVIKSLGPLFQSTRGLAGAAILGDGRVGLILDLAGLFAWEA